MKASTVLKKARTLIKESGWTKGENARNKYRHKVAPTSPSAVKFCAYGAIHNVLGVKDTYNNSRTHEVLDVGRYLSLTVPANRDTWFSSVDEYNDRDATTFEDVDRWFKNAIKLAQSEGR